MAKELKDYTREELEAEIARRDPFEHYDLEKVKTALDRLAGAFEGVDTEQLKADLRAARGNGCEAPDSAEAIAAFEKAAGSWKGSGIDIDQLLADIRRARGHKAGKDHGTGRS